MQKASQINNAKIKQLEEELEKTKEHLKKYTAPKERMKKYYENHKEEIKKTHYKYIDKNLQ